MARTQGRRDLSPADKQRLIGFLSAQMRPDGTLPLGAIGRTSNAFGCHRNTVTAVWGQRNSTAPPSRQPGRERSYDPDELKAALAAVPLEQRMTVRGAAGALQMPPSTLQLYIGPDGPLRQRTVRVKPTLSEEQKQERLRFVLSFVERPIGTCLGALLILMKLLTSSVVQG